MRRALLPALLLPLACRQDFPPSWRITGLRVLAITLDPPDVAPGSGTRVRVVTADPQSRAVSVRWVACPPVQGEETPGDFRCDSTLVRRGDGADFTLDAPPFPIGTASIPVALRFEVCAGGAATVDDAGVGHCAGSESWEATRTLHLRASDRNANPGLDDVLLDGMPWPADGSSAVRVCAPGVTCEHTLRVVAAASAREIYLSGGSDGGVSVPERLTARYYTTVGTLAGETVGDPSETVTSDLAMHWTAPSQAGTASFWFVLDDGRGGVSVATRALTAR